MLNDWLSVVVKAIHIGAIAFWAAGLIALPFMYRQRVGLEGTPLHRLHAFTRRLYVGVVSPAAFLAIGSGTVLIFLRGTYRARFSAKLVLVAVLAGIHIFSGLMVLRLFEPEGRYPMWRFAIVVPATLLVVASIPVLVLGKPTLTMSGELAAFFEPGALSRMAGRLIGGLK
ncbi:CopD family protein [Devosia sp. A8/3-2]|nr:CopD family protein [Devosia sp. A8/3-2]